MEQFDSNSRWKEAIQAHDQGDFQTALKLFFEVDLCAKSAYNVGVLEMKLSQYEEAKAAFAQAIELDTNFTVAYLQMGVCHYILNELIEARRNFQATIESGRGLLEVDYVHVLLDYNLLKEKVEFNLALCSRKVKSETNLPFGAPHRLYLPPRQQDLGVGMPQRGCSKKSIHNADPATKDLDYGRPRALSDSPKSRTDPRDQRKNRSNSLGEMWEKLFHSLKKKPKKNLEANFETQYTPITSRKFMINRCLSNSEGELPSARKNTLRRSSLDPWRINPQEVQMGEEIGRGSFGAVFYAKWRGADCCCKVPAKIHKDNVRFNFIAEINHMRKLIHPNICQFLGICEDPLCIVIELMAEGSVINLINNKSVQIDPIHVVSIAKQTSCGMLYLHSKGVLHGDLAARNLLFRTELGPDGTKKYVIKITDFGLSILAEDESCCDVSDRTSFPIRWSAPEVLNQREMSKASDTWSFGVLLWELLQRAQPYAEFTAEEVIDHVKHGYRLPHPTRISYPKELAQLMDKCWLIDPICRPDFSQVEIMLEIIENSLIASPPRPPRPQQCQECTNRIEKGDRFCRFCGHKME